MSKLEANKECKDGMKRKLLGYYDYTVILTYCGMLFGFCGIISAINQNYCVAVFCLMAAGVCDMFDGMVAATKQRDVSQKRFGIQIDSLSDLICFGVFPGIFVYMISEKNMVAGLCAAMFTLCALIRLAYFNVHEEERQEQTPEKRKSYLGVPVTTIAILLPAVYLLYDYKMVKTGICFTLLLIITGIGFIVPVKIKKPVLIGKICLIILGIIEAVGVLIFMGFDAV